MVILKGKRGAAMTEKKSPSTPIIIPANHILPLTASKDKALRAKYLVLQKERVLPDFDTLNLHFDIESIDPETKRIVKECAKRAFDQIDLFHKTLETLMQPDASILLMQEAEFLTETDHEKVADLARRTMRLDRRMLRAELLNTDDEYAEFLRQVTEEWPQMQKELLAILQKLEQGWSGKRKSDRQQNYLG
jgi:hypothetical protein